MGLQREKILAQSLMRAGILISDSVEESSDQAAKVAKQSYDFNFNQELGRFPWGFASERSTLGDPVADRGLSSEGFRYRFEIPKEVRCLWDIYLSTPSFDVNALENFYRPQISLPLIQTPGHLRGIAEVLNGGIESDSQELLIFYTHRREIDENLFSVPFIDILTNSIVLDLKEWKVSDASVLSYHSKRKKEGRDAGHYLGSVENQRIKSVAYTPLVQRMMRLPR